MKNLFAKLFKASSMVAAAIGLFCFFVDFGGASFGTAYAKSRKSKVKVYQGRKYITLFVGLEHYERISNMPPKPEFRGDFKKTVRLAYAPQTKQLRFTPMSQGTSSLTITRSDGKIFKEFVITVKKGNLTQVAREIKALLGEIEGIKVRIINNKVVIDGEVLLPRDINRIHSVASQYDGLVSNITRLSPIAQRKISELIERDINNPEIHVRTVGETFILEGVANDDNEKKRAEVIAKTYIPDLFVKPAPGVKTIKRAPVINLISVRSAPPPEPGKIIQLVVHYVELQKDYEKGFRFQFAPDLNDGTQLQFSTGSRSPGSILTSITGTISNLLPKLNWAKQHGHARVLQSSSVIVQNGKPGKIISKTRIPYQVINQQGQPSTNFEETGINTNITPKLVNANSDSVEMSIEFDLSALVGISDSGPLISQNRIQTFVTVRSGMSAAIGGLVANTSGTDYNKLPKNVSSNPIISLYSSKSFRRNQSQFVVFVTPIIKSSASSGADLIKRKFRLRD